jgi:hypothetical protein
MIKWGKINIPSGDRCELLYWALMFALSPNRPADHWIQSFMKAGGAIGGDSGWEIAHFGTDSESGYFKVWADPEISGIEPSEATYEIDELRTALKESLLVFATQYPEKVPEVKEVLLKYNL